MRGLRAEALAVVAALAWEGFRTMPKPQPAGGRGLLPGEALAVYALSGALWLVAFALFVVEYGPMLAKARRRI